MLRDVVIAIKPLEKCFTKHLKCDILKITAHSQEGKYVYI